MYFSQNPYRVIGIPSNSGIKIIQKNLSKLKAFSKLGKDLEFDFDFNFLNLDKIDRSSAVISKVESKILLDENKLKYSLFWFQDVTSYDSIALAKLVKGDTDKASEIWAKAMKSGEVSIKNFSAFNNASSLLLLLQLDESKKDQFKNNNSSIYKLKEALNQKIKLIKSDFFPEYCLSLGIKSDINVQAIQSFLADKILEILNLSFSNKQLLEVVNDLDKSFSELINSNLVKEPISNIKEQVNLAVLELKNNVKDGLLIGKTLIKNTVTDLRYLKQTLGKNHYQYESLADKVSNQIIQCGILYFNETGDDQIYLNSYKYALSIAPNDKTVTRAKNTIKHCEEEKLVNTCWFCEKNQISQNLYYRYQMHKWDSPTVFNFNRTYTYFKEGGLKLGCCKTCRDRHNETIFHKIYYYFKGIERPKVKNNRNYTLRRHPIVLKKIKEGYEPGLPN